MTAEFRYIAWLGFVLAIPSVVAVGFGQQAAHSATVVLNEAPDHVTLSNGYFDLQFDRASHRIVYIAADHTGKRKFGKNLLGSEGIQFSPESNSADATTHLDVISRRPGRVVIRLRWSGDSMNPDETMTLSLGASDRGAQIQVACPRSVKSCGDVSLSLQQWFLLGIFKRGVVQYVAGQDQSFTSHNPLQLFYTMDRDNGSIAIKLEAPAQIAETTLVSTKSPPTTEIELHLSKSNAPVDQWTPLIPAQHAATLQAADRAQFLRFEIYANDLPFPAYESQNKIIGEDGIEDHDSAAYFTAVYGSAAGVLGSYAQDGSGYPTLATPRRAYGTGFDFFDPDAWEIVTTLSYSGDPLLQNEARKILERSEAGMLPDGQVPHHFQGSYDTLPIVRIFPSESRSFVLVIRLREGSLSFFGRCIAKGDRISS